MADFSETAYAKINLALHVRRRRPDGYHDIETLFAFLDDGDQLSLKPSRAFELQISGPFGTQLSDEAVERNLITRAARALCGGELPKVNIALNKRLPIASGLGGGSADAAATIRLLCRYLQMDIKDAEIHQIASALGADVPACIASTPVIGRDTGINLAAVENDVAGLACLLVNPGEPLSTPPVFKNWNGIDLGPMPDGTASAIMADGRNDLEGPAIMLCPPIEDVLACLRETDPLLIRMSGSGATCFAIYPDDEQAAIASAAIRDKRPEYWQMVGRLR